MKARYFFLPLALFCLALLANSCAKEDLNTLEPEREKLVYDLKTDKKEKADEEATADEYNNPINGENLDGGTTLPSGDVSSDDPATNNNLPNDTNGTKLSGEKAVTDGPTRNDNTDLYTGIKREPRTRTAIDEIGRQQLDPKKAPIIDDQPSIVSQKHAYGDQREPSRESVKPLPLINQNKATSNDEARQ